MDRKLREALGRNFTPPPSQKKNDFIDTVNYPKEKFTKVLLSQVGFIRKRVWIGFALLLVSAFTLTNYAQLSRELISILSAMLPIFSLLATAEIYKSSAHNMAEMELACKYDLLKITLMRLSILGFAGFIILLVFVSLVNGNDYGAFRNLIYLSVPYLISANLSLIVILKYKSKDTSYVCASVSLGVSVFILALHSNYQFLYNVNYTFAWVISFTVLFVFLVINLVKFKTAQEELQWNFV